MRRVWVILAVLVALIAGVVLLGGDDEGEPCGSFAVARDRDVALADDPALALLSHLTIHGDGGVIRGSDWPKTLDEPDKASFTHDDVTVIVRREAGGWRATEKRVDCG